MLSLVMSCVDPYQPPFTNEITNILVVDGFINTSDQSATVKLTRAVRLSDAKAPSSEKKAIVSIEEQGGAVTLLAETGNGIYSRKGIALNSSKNYRLIITAADGKKYTSDFITLQQTPPIDGVRWGTSPDGVNIYVNTHDPSGTKLFYRWNFVETWLYNSAFYSSIKLVNGAVVLRSDAENIYDCWKTVSSSDILVSSTVRLSETTIRDFPITTIPKGSQKLLIRYSLQVNQFSLSKEAYDYWQQLRKTTTNLGGLFDPLPSQVTGNVHSESDPMESVLGFFSGGSVSSKRIFISLNDLPPALKVSRNIGDCTMDSVLVKDVKSVVGVAFLLVSPYGTPFTIGYQYSSVGCVDCRKLGGTTTRPDFW